LVLVDQRLKSAMERGQNLLQLVQCPMNWQTHETVIFATAAVVAGIADKMATEAGGIGKRVEK
jgi:hypothetical protein